VDIKKVCLVIIDMQHDFLDESSPLFVQGGPLIIVNLLKVLTFFRKNKLPVIFVRRIHRNDGSDVDKPRVGLFKSVGGFLLEGSKGAEIVEAIKPLPSEVIVTKKRWSAFFQTELDLILRRYQIETLILTGVQMPNCIRATATDAISLDYDVVILEDGTASSSIEVQKGNLIDMANMGAKILKTDEVIELLSSNAL
jgi:nicotinamidase-related amidase